MTGLPCCVWVKRLNLAGKKNLMNVGSELHYRGALVKVVSSIPKVVFFFEKMNMKKLSGFQIAQQRGL